MEFEYVFPRVLNRRRILALVCYRLCLILAVASLLAAYFATTLPVTLMSGKISFLFFFATLRLRKHYAYLRGQLCDAYSWAPAGVYFTGSIYRQTAARSLPGMKEDEYGAMTHLTKNPYPDGEALGCNGVIQAEGEHPRFALLISVNGRVNATPVRPAQYGWQEFIQYRL